mmetsp:Transcript_4094/g.14308  ORF Transcript_4094/g.14308 Transcript_4094/m.14308 type:complete len:206 (+) Transcript_4094:340-957(+)
MRSARRMLRSEARTTREQSSGGSVSPSFFATFISKSSSSGADGAGTRTATQRLRTASSTFETLLQTRTRRQLAEYLSMVRRSECCASFESLSTSLSSSSLYPRFPVTSSGLDLAISLITSCTTYRSLLPASLGLSSTWLLLDTVVSSRSTFREPTSSFHVLPSTLSFSAEGPKSSRSRASASVFLPAPDGPYSSKCGQSPSLTIL